MKKSKVDKILVEQAKRRKYAFSCVCVIIAFLIFAILFVFIYLSKTKDIFIKYDETSNIDYQVYLKENEYFKDEYLGPNNSYIASLIDHINADFSYKMSLKEFGGDFKFSYRIEAEVDVKEKNATYSLYNFKKEVLKGNEQSLINKNEASINESVVIDYNEYNDLIKGFLKTYNLENTVSTLTLRMYINVAGTCQDYDNNINESVMAIEIPLTTRTMNIEISNDLIETSDNIMACNKDNGSSVIYLIIAIIMGLIDIFYTFMLTRFLINTRTARDIYNKELKKILNNYHTYIQKINNELDLSKYERLKVDTFTDMLEIRDMLQQPILMVESKNKDGVYFIIPSSTNILYTYGLKLCDIKKKLFENVEKDSEA